MNVCVALLLLTVSTVYGYPEYVQAIDLSKVQEGSNLLGDIAKEVLLFEQAVDLFVSKVYQKKDQLVKEELEKHGPSASALMEYMQKVMQSVNDLKIKVDSIEQESTRKKHYKAIGAMEKEILSLKSKIHPADTNPLSNAH